MEWCNSFVLVPQANGKVRLCLDPARLSQVLIRPVQRSPPSSHWTTTADLIGIDAETGEASLYVIFVLPVH